MDYFDERCNEEYKITNIYSNFYPPITKININNFDIRNIKRNNILFNSNEGIDNEESFDIDDDNIIEKKEKIETNTKNKIEVVDDFVYDPNQNNEIDLNDFEIFNNDEDLNIENEVKNNNENNEIIDNNSNDNNQLKEDNDKVLDINNLQKRKDDNIQFIETNEFESLFNNKKTNLKSKKIKKNKKNKTDKKKEDDNLINSIFSKYTSSKSKSVKKDNMFKIDKPI